MVCRPPVTSLSWHRDVIYSYCCSQLSHGVFGSELRSLGLCITLALSSLCSQSQPCTHETSPALASQGRGLPALGNTSGLVSHYTLCYGSGAAALITGHGILELWRLRCEWEIPLTGLSFSVWRGLGGVTLLKEDPLCGQALRVYDLTVDPIPSACDGEWDHLAYCSVCHACLRLCFSQWWAYLAQSLNKPFLL